jgi:hypothetical protein
VAYFGYFHPPGKLADFPTPNGKVETSSDKKNRNSESFSDVVEERE